MLDPVDTPLGPGTLLRRVGDRAWLVTCQAGRLEHDPLSFDLIGLDLLGLAAQLVVAYAHRHPTHLGDAVAKLQSALTQAPFDRRTPTGGGHDLRAQESRAPSAEGHIGVDAGGHFTWLPTQPPDNPVP